MGEPNWNFLKDGEEYPKFTTITKGIWTMCNPVFQKQNGEWGFCDETWADSYGPFATYEEADKACERYAKECL